MTSAVLKNRILNITKREFNQEDYGARTFLHLLSRLPDLVEIEGVRPPHIVRLVHVFDPQPEEENRQHEMQKIDDDRSIDWRQIRVREDLWRAVVDYTTGARYVLDENTGRARPARTEDIDRPSLPTIDPNVLKGWRQDFISRVTAVDSTPSLLEELADWEATGGRSLKLPPSLRGSWNEALKRHVVDRLKAWFVATGSRSPDDLIVSVLPAQAAAGLSDALRLRKLRDLVIAHIRVMTYEELLVLHIPAASIARMSGQ